MSDLASNRSINTALLSAISPIEVKPERKITEPKFNSVMFSEKKEGRVVNIIERICEAVDLNQDGSDMTRQQVKVRADGWAEEGYDILTAGGDDVMDTAFFAEVEEYFKLYEVKETQNENRKQFERIEGFVNDEKNMGRKRREAARLLAASEEVRVAADVAGLKAYRLKAQSNTGGAKLQEKIADAEKSYANRKAVIAKAAQMASSDCRSQFKRVREFFQMLHDDRKVKLRAQYDRSVKIQSMLHRLRKMDPRVMSLEQNTAERIF